MQNAPIRTGIACSFQAQITEVNKKNYCSNRRNRRDGLRLLQSAQLVHHCLAKSKLSRSHRRVATISHAGAQAQHQHNQP